MSEEYRGAELRESWRANAQLSARLAEVSSACVAAERRVAGLEERLLAVRAERDRLTAETAALKTKVAAVTKMDDKMSKLDTQISDLRDSLEKAKIEKVKTLEDLAMEKLKTAEQASDMFELRKRLRDQELEILEIKRLYDTSRASFISEPDALERAKRSESVQLKNGKQITKQTSENKEISSSELDTLRSENSRLLKELEKVVADREALRKKLASLLKSSSFPAQSSSSPCHRDLASPDLLEERRAREGLQREVFSLREKLAKTASAKDTLAQRVLQLEHAQLRALARPPATASAAAPSPSARSAAGDELAAVLAVEPLVLKL
jgi:hypothetical protein